MADQDASATTFGSRVNKVETEQKIIHYDLSRMTQEMKALKIKNEKQKKITIGAFALAGLALIL